MVYDFLLRHSQELSLEDYCRLYILLGISEFLYPSCTIRIFPILFTIVDDLGSLGKHNQGELVYEYLVGSICNASMCLMQKGNTIHFHIVGCVYLLQVFVHQSFELKFDVFQLQLIVFNTLSRNTVKRLMYTLRATKHKTTICTTN